jgi:ferrous iron transport protein B
MSACHGPPLLTTATVAGNAALVGHPNVGKSALFQRITGRYVTVSNYPGTTVELSRGPLRALPDLILLDTPGITTLPTHSDDEQITARVLLDTPLRAVVQVGDAKSPRRMLGLSVRLAELGLPLVVVCNMADEAASRGVQIDHERFAAILGVPVLSTVATSGRGVEGVVAALQHAAPSSLELRYPPAVERVLERLSPFFAGSAVTPRGLALLWLSGDAAALEWAAARLDPAARAALADIRAGLERGGEGIMDAIEQARAATVERLAAQVIRGVGRGSTGISERLGRLATHPLWGLPTLAVVLYAFYWFVGVLGAGALVGLLEEELFGRLINPWVTLFVRYTVPIPLLSEFLVGEYGLWTMGMTYALALLLPIVGTFFIAFGILEDSGYLPRLAVLSNRLFKLLGLNGQAVLPMVLGLGCVTMATMTTRILERRRDRILVTLLLALAVPCSAQLGVVMGMLASISFTATLIWGGVLAAVLFSVGWLAARLLPGERAPLLIELPPLRLPRLSNVLIKTLARLEWYIKEAVPLFLLGTAALFALDISGALPGLIALGEPLVVGWLGLPAEASAAFLIGFLRRDFGATGLFAMQHAGALTPRQTVVALVTLTLFIPCIASVTMIARERGWRTAAGMVALIFPLALLVGGLVHHALRLTGWDG